MKIAWDLHQLSKIVDASHGILHQKMEIVLDIHEMDRCLHRDPRTKDGDKTGCNEIFHFPF